MRKHLSFQSFPAVVRLIAASAVLAAFLVSCGGEPTEPDTDSGSSASDEKNAVSATDSASSAETATATEFREGFVYSSEDRSGDTPAICVERVYYDGSPTPETERVVYLRAPADAVDVVIPDGVTEIGSEAFRDCANLESVVFPNTVNMIPAHAVSYSTNTKLKSVVLPAYASIESRAFYFFTSLESVTLNKDGKPAAPPRDGIQIGDEAFGFCVKLKQFEFPKGIRSIEKMVFINCFSLESVTLPDGVETIGERAFCQCEALKTLHLPDSLKTIGAGAFSNCDALTEIEIPEGVKEIADDAFLGAPCRESVRKLWESRKIGAPPVPPKEN